jgi:protease I
LVYPMYRLSEAGYNVAIAAEKAGEFHGIQGVKFKANAAFSELVASRFDVLIIPGGVKCMEHLRLNELAVHLVKSMNSEGKVVASMCSGAQMLISAGIVKGRTISSYPAMRVDVENAGAEWFPAVYADGNIVTAPHYDLLGSWMAAVLVVARDQLLWRQSATCAAAL